MKQSFSQIGEIMHRRHETVAVAESATAGTLQSLFSRTEQATSYFQGGITTYLLEQKILLLGVSFEEAVQCNCVSKKVAAQMASGVAELFRTDWGIGFTGYATPVPSLDIEKLFGYYAIWYKNEIVCHDILFSKEHTMKAVQEDYADKIFNQFFSLVSK